MPVIVRKILALNPVLIFAMYGLLIFSVIAIESAARHLPQTGEWFADRQKIWIIVGTLVYFTVSLIDYRWLKWLSIPMYFVGLAMMAIVIGGGSEVHQISIAGISFQPTQLMIGSGIILIGLLFEQLPRWKSWLNHPFIKLAIVAVFCGVPFLLVVKVGDMGSALVWIPVAVVALFLGGIPYRYLTVMLFGVIAILPVLYYIILPKVSDRASGRIDQYIEMMKNDGEVELNDDTYAIYYVTTAIGKAGWKGVGLNAGEEEGSLHAKKFIPWKTAHNDYIFGVIGEEVGFRGSVVLISTFFLLLLTCLVVGFFAKDLSGLLISCGVAALFFAHLFENIGMCIRIMPITGIPLPLVSYSGSFTLICMLLLGYVQSVWVHRIKYTESLEDRRRVRMLEI